MGTRTNPNSLSTSPPAHVCGLTPFSQSPICCGSLISIDRLSPSSLPMPLAMAFELAVFTDLKFLFLPPAQGAPECVRLQMCPQSWPLVFVSFVIHTRSCLFTNYVASPH